MGLAQWSWSRCWPESMADINLKDWILPRFPTLKSSVRWPELKRGGGDC